MGKPKKKDVASSKQEDEKQTKISRFFENKLGNKGESALFTKIQKSTPQSFVRQPVSCRHINPDQKLRKKCETESKAIRPKKDSASNHTEEEKENNDDDIVYIGSDDVQVAERRLSLAKKEESSLREVKEQASAKACINNEDERSVNDSDLQGATNAVLSINPRTPHRLGLTSSEMHVKDSPLDHCAVVSSADTDCKSSTSGGTFKKSEVITTPKKTQQQKASDSSPEVICDTPGVSLECQEAKAKKRKIYASRSFLRSSDLLTAQPDLKPVHLRVQGKARPRKLLGTVSVSFRDKSKSDSSVAGSPVSNAAILAADDQDVDGSSSPLPKKCDSNTTRERNVDSSDQRRASVSEPAHARQRENPLESKCVSLLAPRPCSVPETQVLEKSHCPTTAGGHHIEQNDSDEEDRADRVFDQSSHDLEMAVEKYLSTVDDCNGEDKNLLGSTNTVRKWDNLESDKSEQEKSLPLKTDLRKRFSRQAMSWDGCESKRDRQRSIGETCEPTNVRSKLLGALENAEVKAKEAESRMWLQERMVKDMLQGSSTLEGSKTTPVKIYTGETVTVKRQAKPGSSPFAKRAHSSDYTDLLDLHSDYNLSRNLAAPRANAAKKVLNYESTESAPQPKKFPAPKNKFTRQRAIEFGLKPKEKLQGSDTSITLKDDTLLADLLDGLNSPRSKTNSEKCKPSVTQSISHGGMKSGSVVELKKSTLGKTSKEDERLLESLLGEPLSDVGDADRDEAGTSSSPSTRLFNKGQKSEPIVIEESQEHCVESSEDDDIIIDEDLSTHPNKLDILDEEIKKCSHAADQNEMLNSKVSVQSNVHFSGEDHLTNFIASKLDSVKSVDGKTDKDCTDTKVLLSSSFKDGHTKLRPEPLPCLFKEAEAITTAQDIKNPLTSVVTNENNCEDFHPENKSLVVASRVHSKQPAVGSHLNNRPTAEESTRAEDSSRKEDLLSSSICDMLSESFNDEFLQPQSDKVVRRKQDFVFTDLWNRFLVTGVNYHRDVDQLVLDLSCERKQAACQCFLRGFWADTKVKKGDVVNVLADSEDGNFVVDDKRGLVVVNPDLLLSGTLVVSAVFCPRKSVLNEQFKGADKGNVHMLYGSIIHSLFQEVLRDGAWRQRDVETLAASRLKSSKFLHEMYGQNVAESTVMEEIGQYIPSLITWINKHSSIPKAGSRNSSAGKQSDVIVTEIQDIEENVWSPRFGLKGKIDLTVKTQLRKKNASTEVKVLPLELKTGKASFSSEHKGQVTLYSMMFSDRRADPQEGLLLYLKHGEMESVAVKPESQSGLVQLRNRLAHDLSRQVTVETDEHGGKSYLLGRLPSPINNERACSKCAHLQSCSIYQRSVEKTEFSPDHAMSRLVPEAVRHLTEEDLSYFLHWVLCLDVEGKESGRRQLSSIWCSSSSQREQEGDCLSNLVITGSELGVPESQSFNDGKGCTLTFSRHPGHPGAAALNSVGLTAGDMVVLSSEDGRLIALATGFVRNISATLVEIVVDRDYLHNTSAYKSVKFRLDRNDSFSTAGYLYTNLSRLMDPTPQGSWLRDVIIQRRPPEFELKVSKADLYKVKSVFKPLNKPQRTAILKVLMAKDYVLIKGFPGTGKTSTIVALVKILQTLGFSVLLTSYTHSAVDNILLKLKKEGVSFLRLGRQGRIHPSILAHSAEVLTNSPSIDSVQALRDFYNSYSIVATSCLGVSNHPVFQQRHFDVCVVDEASQVLQPACLGPLFHCRKFVLVGDPKQLPPVVQSKEARILGMDESLFAKLDNRGATYDLNLQYRMNRVIMDLSNRLVYAGQLQCGDPRVAEQHLEIDASVLSDQPMWIKTALNPDIQNSVVFIDTQKISAPETQDGRGLKNETEADVVLILLKQLLSAGVAGDSVGVISPYRSQVKLLQQAIQACPLVADVEVNTVDQYQGRDKSVILVSFVRSSTINAGELLKDMRRLNVALTRARCKLILIGNSTALRTYDNLTSLLDWLQESQNMAQIPEDHSLELTQASLPRAIPQ